MKDKEIEFEEEKKILVLKQNLDLGYAGEVWDASLVLVYFIKKQNKIYNENKNDKKIIFNPKGKIILELGAATGLNGFTCGIFGAKRIYLTDKGGCCKLLDVNYDINKGNFDKELECIVQELDWTLEEQKEAIKDKENIDYIIGSDLVWNPKLREPLVNTIKYFMNLNKKLECFLSFEIRNNELLKFFDLFEKDKYKIERIPDYLYDEEYKSNDIIITRIRSI